MNSPSKKRTADAVDAPEEVARKKQDVTEAKARAQQWAARRRLKTVSTNAAPSPRAAAAATATSIVAPVSASKGKSKRTKASAEESITDSPIIRPTKRLRTSNGEHITAVAPTPPPFPVSVSYAQPVNVKSASKKTKSQILAEGRARASQWADTVTFQPPVAGHEPLLSSTGPRVSDIVSANNASSSATPFGALKTNVLVSPALLRQTLESDSRLSSPQTTKLQMTRDEKQEPISFYPERESVESPIVMASSTVSSKKRLTVLVRRLLLSLIAPLAIVFILVAVVAHHRTFHNITPLVFPPTTDFNSHSVETKLPCFRDAGFPIQWTDMQNIKNEDYMDNNAVVLSDDASVTDHSHVHEQGHEEIDGLRKEDTIELPSNMCTNNLLPCPQKGRCKNGILVDCLWFENPSEPPTSTDLPISLGFHVPSKDQTSCVLSPAAVETLNQLVSTLDRMTVADTCQFVLSTSMQTTREENIIYFPIHSVAEQMTMDADLLKRLVLDDTSTNRPFVFKEDSLGLYIGLSTDYVQNALNLPYSCYFKLLFLETISFLMVYTLAVIKIICGVLWEGMMLYPRIMLSLLLVVASRHIKRKIQLSRKIMKDKIMEIRNYALDKLSQCDKEQGYAVLFLRDEIAQVKYPLQGRERDEFIYKLWPRVVHEIGRDNRVLKRKETIKGKGDLEYWEWLSEASRKRKGVE